MSVARVWTSGDSICAVVASQVSLSTEWVECGADKWHDIQISGEAMTSQEIIPLLTYQDAVLSLDGRGITVVSSNDI